MENVLVVGLGEIGSAMIGVLEASGKCRIFKKDVKPLEVKENIDVMHVCIPYFENFADIVAEYIGQYRPGVTIINSTVRPGTSQEIYKKTGTNIVHSPVRGKHPNLKDGLLRFIKFIGPTSGEAGRLAKEHFEGLGIKAEILKSSAETEVGKLLSTTYYALNIAFHQDMERICRKYGADFKQAVSRFNATCTMDIEHKVPRPVMYPGSIGGHCLIPNIGILKKDVESKFLDAVLESNEQKARELKRNSSD